VLREMSLRERHSKPAPTHFYCPVCRGKTPDLYYCPTLDDEVCVPCILKEERK